MLSQRGSRRLPLPRAHSHQEETLGSPVHPATTIAYLEE